MMSTRSFINALLAATMIATSSAPAYSMTGEAGQYIFRYKTPVMFREHPNPETPGQNKDITAYYVGGVGYEFSEKLPMKAEWEDDDWHIVAGSLPDGISFDPETLTFSGTPTTEAMGMVVELEGIDAEGRQTATAAVHFDVYTVRGTPVTVDLYAHTGKYQVDTLSIPKGITVDSWQRVYMPPDGIAVNGPYFEGTPTKAGVYPVFIQGLNYIGEVVATFHGKYTVEDGPTFPLIPDNVRPLPRLEGGSYGLNFNFGAPSPYKPNRLINPSSPAAYYLEIAANEELPVGIASNGLSKNLNLQGYIRQPYDTAKIRIKAVDSDQTVGYSNWFTFGSSDPQPVCSPTYSGYPLTVKTGVASKISVPRPWGKQGVVSYHLASGNFPDGLSLNSATGQIVGTPTLAGQKTDIDIRIDVTNGGNVVSTNCVYRMEVVAGGVSLADATPEQQKHIRAGDVYSGALKVTGGITPYEVQFKAPADWPTLAFTSQIKNTPIVTVSGPVEKAGSHSVEFSLNNGDSTVRGGRLSVYSHGPLDTGTVPTVTVQRLGDPQAWGAVPYDESTVIPEVGSPRKFPKFTIDASASQKGMPEGIAMAGEFFSGTTAAPAGTYGPFTVAMSDFSGQSKTSNPFEVVVTPRDEIAVEAVHPPVFTVRKATEQRAKPVVEKQPHGARQFAKTWTLDGGALPDWLSFDRATGELLASANIPFEAIGEYGPFTVTVRDQEGSTVTSSEFVVRAADWPAPTALVVQAVKSNVSGDVRDGETQTSVTIANLKRFIVPDSVIGGLAAVKFVFATPSSPAGLTFDAANGAFFGVPSEEFNGIVTVSFKDGEDRPGTIQVPLAVLPYPTVAMTAQEYALPRLASASAVSATAVHGFWNAARFEWDSASTPLPDGIAVSANGALAGSTSLAVGSLVEGIRLKAKTTAPDGTTLTARTDPFSIRIANPAPITLAYNPDTATWRFDDADNLVSRTLPTALPSGSYVKPLAYTLDQSAAQSEGMTGNLGINAATGAITGMPGSLGKWTVLVGLRDAENRSLAAPVPLTVWLTLDGDVTRSNGGGAQTLRVGEPFRTEPLAISRAVGTPVFSTSPAMLAQGLVFDATTGTFTDESAFAQAVTNYKVTVDVRDEDNRGFAANNRPTYTLTAVPPLTVSVPSTKRAVASRQYSADDQIDVAFAPSLGNRLGNVRYDLEGELPGTLVRKVYDAAGAFLHYAYTDAHGVAQRETDEAKLPLDALVLDMIAATLRGIPSRAGTFAGVRLVAADDHQDSYIRPVPSQKANNTATSEEITFTIAPANPLVATNQLGGVEGNAETIHQFTTQPTLRATTVNAAYGWPVTWTAVSGALPQGVSAVKGADLAYSGYPEVLGGFANIVWRATDAAGRSADTAPATLTVAPRKELELVAADPIGMLVNVDVPAGFAVTPRFAAHGKAIGQGKWTVTGVDSLPPGVTHTVEDNRVVFGGRPTVAGTYSGVTVAAVDSLGSRATINLIFSVILPTDAIALNVGNIDTKVGYPFEMQASSSNTYGKVRYYSNAITGALAEQLALDADTGLVSGAFKAVQNLSFDVYVTDASSRITSKPVQVRVMPELRVTVPQVVEFVPGIAQSRATATDYVLGTASYAMGNPSEWPAGMSVDPVTGAVLSDGTTPLGDYPNLVIAATDSFTSAGQAFAERRSSNAFTISVTATGPYIGLTGGDIAPWSKRKAGYSQDLAVDEFLTYRNMGPGEIVFSFPAQSGGRRVPPGLSISAAGLITGTPTESGDFEFDVQAIQKSNSKVKAVATYRMAIDLLPLTLELADGALPDAESGKPYSFDFKALLTADNVPEASIAWTKSNVDPDRPLPAGLTLNKSVLSGTPTGADDYEFKVKVSFINNSPQAERIDDERTYRLYVKKAAPYFTSNIANVTTVIGKPITVTPSVANKHADDVYELLGSFPKGLFQDGSPVDPNDPAPELTFNIKTGAISGATRITGEFPMQINVTDKLGQSAVSNTFTLKFLDNIPIFVGEFADRTGVEPNVSYVLSNAILISGNSAPAPTKLTLPAGATGNFRTCASAAEAQTGLCGGTANNPGVTVNIPSGTYVQVWLKASSELDTTVTATLDVGGFTREFRVTTRKVETPRNLGELGMITDAELATDYASNIIKVEGITVDATAKLEVIENVATTAASVWLCGASYFDRNYCLEILRGSSLSTANGSEFKVANNSYLQVRLKSASSFSTAATVKLTIGGGIREFSVTTRGTATTPKNTAQFTSITGAEPGLLYASNVIKIEGISDDATAKLEIVQGLASSDDASVYLCSGNFTTGCTTGTRAVRKSTATGAQFKVTNNSFLQLSAKSSANLATSITVRLTVGDVTRDFTITTKSTAAEFGGSTQFENENNAERSTLAVSNSIQIKGLPAAATATIAVVDGAGPVNAYVCSNATTAASGNCFSAAMYYKSQITTTAGKSVSNGDYVQFALTSSATFDTPVTVKLTVDGVDRLWTVRTRKSVTTPVDLGTFPDVTDLGKGRTPNSDVLQVNGITDPTQAILTLIEGPASAKEKIFVCKSAAEAALRRCYVNFRTSMGVNSPVMLNPGEYIQLETLSDSTFETRRVLKVTIGGVERTWTVKTRKGNTPPENLGHFDTVVDVEPNARVASNVIKVDGITDPVIMTAEAVEGVTTNGVNFYVCAAQYAMTGDCWSTPARYQRYSTSTAGSVAVNSGDYVQVRVLSTTAHETSAKAKFKIGDVERTFEVRTRSIDTTPDDLGRFSDIAGAILNATVTSEAILIAGIKDATPVTVSVEGSTNATTKVFTCTQANAASGKCATSPAATGTAGGAAINVTDGHFIALQTKAAATANTQVRVTVTVGGVSRTWSVQTAK